MRSSEVTKDKYFEMLEVLPPQAQATNGFLVGEPYDHAEDMSHEFGPRYQAYFTENGKYYYGGLASVSDFKTFLVPMAEVQKGKTEEEAYAIKEEMRKNAFK